MLLKILILVLMLILVDSQMFFSDANVPQALFIQAFTSSSEFPSNVILLPRYANSCISSTFFPLILTGSVDFVLIFISFVFAVLMLNLSDLHTYPDPWFYFGCHGVGVTITQYRLQSPDLLIPLSVQNIPLLVSPVVLVMIKSKQSCCIAFL